MRGHREGFIVGGGKAAGGGKGAKATCTRGWPPQTRPGSVFQRLCSDTPTVPHMTHQHRLLQVSWAHGGIQVQPKWHGAAGRAGSTMGLAKPPGGPPLGGGNSKRLVKVASNGSGTPCGMTHEMGFDVMPWQLVDGLSRGIF